MRTKYILTTLLLVLSSVTQLLSATYIWTGTSSTNWDTTSNWSPAGIPVAADYITLNSNAPNNLVLDQNRTVANFTINGDTVDLGTYTLTTTGVTYFNGGLVTNGNLNIAGSLCHFGGATINARIEASCGYYHMNGGLFLKPVDLVSSGTSNTTGTGNCTFEDSLTITHSGVFYFTMGSSTNDFFNGPVTITNHATKEVYMANGDSSFYNANVTISSTGNGGVAFGNGGGVSVLASGKTISIGSGGFGADYLTLKRLKQLGTTAQTLTLTGTAIVNLVGCEFNGNLTLSAGGFLLKDDVFKSASTFTKTGTANCHSDGNNTYNGATSFVNNGSSGRLRLSATEADVYSDHVSFNSTGQDVQVCYTGNNYFYKNVTINSNKVVFNTSTGKVTLAGDTAQSLNGSYNYAFKKLAINKSANHVTANTTLSVDDTLFFVSGNFLTKSSNLLLLKLGSKVVGASDSSYVEGPVKKTGNTAFVFPTGANNSYRPIEISAPATTTSEFTAEFMEDSVMVNTVTRDSTLAYLNRTKYWKLNRNSGSSQVYVTLSWDSLNALTDTFITVASWNGTQWKDLGKGLITGSKVTGNIKSSSTASAYQEFTLGYGSLSTIAFPSNCQGIESEAELRFCLNHASGEINVTDNFFIDAIGQSDPAMLQFPIFIPSYIVLNGLPGTNSPKWWEAGCPLISTNLTTEYHVNNSAFPVKNLYLFEMATGATIQNLRIRGANLDHKDFNDPDFLCGGIYVKGSSNTAANILNCEIFGFSQAGIWKNYDTDLLNIENCYIHKVKGQSKYGIGYGVWTMGKTSIPEVNFTNCIFDDCKTAIDDQGYLLDWNIQKCTFSQFFSSEDINKHEDNTNFHIYYLDNGVVFQDCHILFPCPSGTDCYFGTYSSNGTIFPNCNSTFPITQSYTYSTNWVPCFDYAIVPPYYIPIYHVGGANTTIEKSIFHKKRTLNPGENGNGNIKLTLPNLNEGAFSINVNNNTFATHKYTANEAHAVNNYGGYAKIADNYIEACVWDNTTTVQKTGNFFDYKPGSLVTPVAPNAPQPHELSLELNDGTNALPTSYSLSPLEGHKYIQYVDVNTAFNLEASITNAGSSAESYYIIRPNPNDNGPITGSADNVISSENYFFDSEERLNGTTITKSFTYNKPGLYGIDVMGFDAHDYGTADYDFRASSWQHIPVIVKGTQEQMLYFNIKDSYHIAGAALTGVKKQAYLNKLLIWEEDIAEGGDGWELVEIDLTGFAFNGTTNILDSIHTDGTENTLSFSIYMEYPTLNSPPFSGVQVYVDDIYIPKTRSATGDNLVKDGSVELSKENLCTECYWFQNLADQSTGGCGNTAASINSIERKSGNQSLYLEIPFKVGGCTFTNSINKVVASIGTNIDFTDLLSCNDYWTPDVTPLVPNGGHSNVNFEPFPGTLNVTYSKRKFWIGNDITIDNSEVLTFEGCELAISPGVEIIVNSGGTLIITYDFTSTVMTPSHLFSCDEMWKGITVNPGGILVLDGFLPFSSENHCKIENAEVAVNAIGNGSGSMNPSIYLDHVTFTNNLIPTKLIDDDYGSAVLKACKFECESGYLTKVPHQGVYPQNHILLEDVSEVTIGGSGNVLNTFADIYSGIKVVRSNVYILRSYFMDLKNNNVSPAQNGIGILTENSSNVTCTLEVGATTQFKNLHRGIFSRGNFNIDIHNVEFFRDIDDVAIALFHYNYNNDIEIINVGNFERTNIGVVVSGSKLHSVIVSNNKFTNTDFMETSTSAFHNTAITIRGQGMSTANVQVLSNQIKDFRIGIHAINILHPYIYMNAGPIVSSVAQPMFNHTSSFSPSEKYRGIWLQNCPEAFVRENVIENSDEITSLTSNFRGIDVEHSADCHINCNVILNIPCSFHFLGHCDGTLLRANDMTHYDEGVHLESATIADQFQVGNSSGLDEPTDNIWNDPDTGVDPGTSLPNPTDRVAGTINASSPFNWYYRTSGGNYNPLDAGMTSPIVAATPETAGSVVCNDETNRQSRMTRFGLTVTDTMAFASYEEENFWMTRKYAYECMKGDTTLLYADTLTDAAYQSFFLAQDSLNTGKFTKIRLLSDDSATFGDASVLNELVVDEMVLETHLKAVNSYYFTKLALGDTLDDSDSSNILEIALLPYFEGGEASFIGIGMLGLEHTPSIPQLRLGNENPTITIPTAPAKQSATIYPNPADEYFYVKNEGAVVEKLEIYDSKIKLIKTIEFNIVGRAISVNYKPGVYGVKLYLVTGEVKWFKLVVL